MKNITSQLFALLSTVMILAVLAWVGFSMNAKIDKINGMWASANQATIQNQHAQVRVNQVFSRQLDRLETSIDRLPVNQRKAWMKTYSKQIQEDLYTPPKGLVRHQYLNEEG